jgi:hypothetical protein
MADHALKVRFMCLLVVSTCSAISKRFQLTQISHERAGEFRMVDVNDFTSGTDEIRVPVMWPS